MVLDARNADFGIGGYIAMMGQASRSSTTEDRIASVDLRTFTHWLGGGLAGFGPVLPFAKATTSAGNLFGGAVGVDQAFIMQMLIPAFEARGWTYDLATGQGTGLDIRGAARRGACALDQLKSGTLPMSPKVPCKAWRQTKISNGEWRHEQN